MKKLIGSLGLIFVLAACEDNSYERHSETHDLNKSDSVSGFQTGKGTESIADPNAANTKRTPVPLEQVVVDTTSSKP